MTVEHREGRERHLRRIPTRKAASVGGLASVRCVARSMVDSGLAAVLVENPAGPVGIVTSKDVVEAVAAGGDPDLVWAGEIMRPVPRVVSSEQDPADVGDEMTAYELEVVSVVDEDAALGIASALDILRAVLQARRDPEQ